MRNHWLRKKASKEDFLKCVCRIWYQYDINGTTFPNVGQFPFQLKLTWEIPIQIGDCSINVVEIYDKKSNLILFKHVGITTQGSVTFDFSELILNGFKAKDVF
jgi:sporulation-control protein spo0M